MITRPALLNALYFRILHLRLVYFWNLYRPIACSLCVRHRILVGAATNWIANLRVEELGLLTYVHTYITQHTPYQGFSVTGYIRTGTGVKQTEVECELTNGA